MTCNVVVLSEQRIAVRGLPSHPGAHSQPLQLGLGNLVVVVKEPPRDPDALGTVTLGSLLVGVSD